MGRTRGLTLVEVVVMVVIVVVVVLVVLLPALRQQRMRRLEQRNQVACQGNLKQMGLALSMYATEHDGEYPPLQTWVGDDCDEKNTDVLMFNGPMMYPDYLSDVSVLVCPSDADGGEILESGGWDLAGQPGVINPCRIDDSFYVYLAWVLYPSERTVAQAADSSPGPAPPGANSEWPGIEAGLWEVLASPDPALFLEPLKYTDPVSGEERSLPRMGEGAARSLAGSAAEQASVDTVAARVPVLHDPLEQLGGGISGFNHMPPASNVLFLDGHVEFVRFPTRFPLVPEWALALGRLRSSGPPPRAGTR